MYANKLAKLKLSACLVLELLGARLEQDIALAAMVQSLFPAANKAEGDKNGSARQANPATSSTTITRNNSNGSECLFSRSTEELLDLDLDLELRATSAHTSQRQYQATTSQSAANPHQSPFDKQNGFSIDSREQKSYNQFCASSRPASFLQRLFSGKHKLSRWPRRCTVHLDRFIKMILKRYYLILFCLSLVIICCLVASLVISRSVGGDLDDNHNDANSPQSSRLASSSDQSQRVASRPPELEDRSIDIVDLIDCGKTFAYSKYRVSVKVPKSSSTYNQQPSFLIKDEATVDRILKSHANTNDQGMLAASTNQYHLVSVQELLAESSSHEAITVARRDPLELEIKPVRPAPASAPLPAGMEDLAALLAMSTAGGSNPAASQQSAPSLDQIDPLELAASEMNLNLESMLNKTMIDCFLVDTDKRYDQKIRIEDLNRSIASTRRVSFKEMMRVIVDCRQLTWSSLPDKIKIKSIPGEQPLASELAEQLMDPAQMDAAEQIPQQTSSPKPQNFLGSLLNNWLFGTQQPPVLKADSVSVEPIALAQIKPYKPASRGGESLQSSSEGSQGSRTEQPAVQQDKKQASLLGMGISMVNGIIPNTLWCGLGDRAANYSELGSEYRVDACCRAHDHCPIRLGPFTTDYGLINWSVSTRSHCECDLDFSYCLNRVNSTLSNVIKVLYFRFVGLQCIDVGGRRKTIEIPE